MKTKQYGSEIKSRIQIYLHAFDRSFSGDRNKNAELEAAYTDLVSSGLDDEEIVEVLHQHVKESKEWR